MAGEYSFTFKITDNLGLTDSKSCSVTIYPLTACGSFDFGFEWRRNSRVGPFFSNGFGQLYGIGADTDKLIAVGTSDFGEGWSILNDTYPSLAAGIGSFDAHDLGTDAITPGDDILIATQSLNPSGRVAFGHFSKASDTWIVQNTQVVASATISTSNENCTVSITRRNNGEIWIMYDTDPETVAAVSYRRCAARFSSNNGTTWSAEIQIGHWGQAINDTAGRVIADNSNRLHFFFGNTDTPFFGHYYVQSRLSDNSLTSITQWFQGGALTQIQTGRCIGDYCTWLDGSDFYIGVPLRLLDKAAYAIFLASDAMTTPTLGPSFFTGSPTTFLAANSAICPQVSMRHDGTDLHMTANQFNNVVPTWFYHKQSSSPFTTWTPANATDDQAGPRWTSAIPGQEVGASVKVFATYPYLAMFNNSSTVGLGVTFNLIRVDQLPTSALYSMTQWAIDCPASP